MCVLPFSYLIAYDIEPQFPKYWIVAPLIIGDSSF